MTVEIQVAMHVDQMLKNVWMISHQNEMTLSHHLNETTSKVHVMITRVHELIYQEVRTSPAVHREEWSCHLLRTDSKIAHRVIIVVVCRLEMTVTQEMEEHRNVDTLVNNRQKVDSMIALSLFLLHGVAHHISRSILAVVIQTAICGHKNKLKLNHRLDGEEMLKIDMQAIDSRAMTESQFYSHLNSLTRHQHTHQCVVEVNLS